MINQLSYKEKKKVGDSNRLIVVHNLIDVFSQEILERRKADVAECYWVPDLPIEDTFRPLQRTISILNQDVQYTYYQTKETVHLFLVRHPRTPSEGDWCYINNTACVEVIKQLLLTSNPRKFNLLNEFIIQSNMLFLKYGYIKNWDQTYAIKYVQDEKTIRPVRVKSNIESFGTIKTEEDFRDGDYVEEVNLSGMQITDIGEVITEGQSKLLGNVFSNHKHHVITVVTPGISSLSDISFSFIGWKGITITFQLPFSIAEEDKIYGEYPSYAKQELHSGTAIFSYMFSEDEPFRRPKKDNRADLDQLCTLKDGILTVRLIREDNCYEV